MATTNQMGTMLNKIERKLGLLQVNLPESLSKETWVQVIIEDSLTEFSRLYPLVIPYMVDFVNDPRHGDWLMIDQKRIEGYTYLGIQDLDFSKLAADNRFYMQQMGLGHIDFMAMQGGIGLEDFAMQQMGADMNGLFNNGLFIEQEGDNMFKVVNAFNYKMPWLRKATLKIKVVHSESLNTISAGMMNIFEQLCMADVATHLYNNLKFYDGQDSGYGQIDLKMDLIESWMNKKDEIMDKLNESSVSAANPACPIMWTI